MNNILVGAGAALGFGIISSIVYVYFKVRDLEAMVLKSQQEAMDAKTVSSVHALAPAELDALLTKDLSPGTSAPPKT